jgi:hypothetical protein
MNVVGSANRKRFRSGVSLAIGIFAAQLAFVAIPESTEAQLSPDILYQRDIRELQHMPEKQPPPVEVKPVRPRAPVPSVERTKPEVKKSWKPSFLASKSQLKLDLKLSEEDLKETEANIQVYQAEIENLRIQQRALQEDAQHKGHPVTEVEEDIQQMNREIGLRYEMVGALEKKKAAINAKIQALRKKIGLLK